MYPVLRALEESGRARRGWFVAGLGAAQFALPGAVDRLRAYRARRTRRTRRASCSRPPIPAQPYGAALALARRARGRPARAPPARTSCSSTASCAVYLERGGKSLLTFGGARRAASGPARSSKRTRRGAIGRLQLERIDDEPARTSPVAPALRDAGFADGYKGLTLRT